MTHEEHLTRISVKPKGSAMDPVLYSYGYPGIALQVPRSGAIPLGPDGLLYEKAT